jgi:hypothetical protein
MSSEKTSTTPQKVKYIYEKAEGVEPIYINGVQGGMNGRGELICNFFFEYMNAPSAEIVPIKEGKFAFDKAQVILRDGATNEEVIVKRAVKVVLVIPAQQISSLANWMLDTLRNSRITVDKSEG